MTTEAPLARRARLNARLGAFSVLCDPGPEAGRTTVSIKEALDVAGLPTTGGAVRPLVECAQRDAAAVARVRAAGYAVVGKTHMVELAFGGWGDNPAFGAPWNPWDARRRRVPGGSSSGAAVAVAAGLCEVGIGSDTGGSVRIPASLCGIVGIKPGRGLVSRSGLHALSPSLDTIGPLAWTVAEAARALEAMSGPDAADDTTLGRPRFDAAAALARAPRGGRAGIYPPAALGVLQPAVEAAYRAALDRLRAIGVAVSERPPPQPLEDYVAPAGVIMGAEAFALHADRLARERARMDPWVVRRLEAGSRAMAGYSDALRRRAEDQARFAAWFDDLDVLVTPATAITAPLLADIDEATLPLSRFTRACNYLDLPAVVLPCGYDAAGLPIGLQIIAGPGREDIAVGLAHAFETAFAPHRRRPDLTAFEAPPR